MDHKEESKLSLVYPFNADNIVPMPPFINLGDGLSINNLGLSVNTSKPINIKNNAVSLSYGTGLTLNEAGELISQYSAAVEPPLSLKDGSINLNYKSPLTVSDASLNLKIDSSLKIDNDKLIINTTDGLKTTEQGLTLQVGQGLTLKTDGINLSVTDGLEIQNNNVKVKSILPLKTSTNGIEIQYNDNDFKIEEDKLSLQNKIENLVFNTPLLKSGDSVSLLFNEKDFFVQNSKLTSKTGLVIPRMIISDEDQYTVSVDCPNNQSALVSGVVYLQSINGIINGFLKIKAIASKWHQQGNSVEDSIRFTVILCPTSRINNIPNYSQWPHPKTQPPNSDELFTPDQKYIWPASIELPNKGSWFISSDQMVVSYNYQFKPYGSLNLSLTTSEMAIGPGYITRDGQGYEVLVCSFTINQLPNGNNFFTPSRSSFETPVLPIQYVGPIVPFNQ